MPPDRTDAARWVEKANRDLRVARRLFGPPCGEPDIVGFHCQQAVEKALKGFLVSRLQPFEKVHDLEYLVSLCAGHDAAFSGFLNAVEPLTVFAVRFRYLGVGDPALDDLAEAVKAAGRVVGFVETRVLGDTA